MATSEARMPNAAPLLPRSALPRDGDIPVLPGMRIAWYGKYWRRRVALALMWAVAEPLAERQARLWVAERLRERGYGTPAG